MADAPEPPAKSGGTFGFLTKKFGPAPVWLWALLAFGIYYWYTHYGPGASSTAANPAGSDSVSEGQFDALAAQQQRTANLAAAEEKTNTAQRKNIGRLFSRTKPPARKTPRKKAPQPNPHSPVGGAGGGPAVQPQAAPSPAYDQFTAGADGAVPEPMQVYAPMTAGAVYG